MMVGTDHHPFDRLVGWTDRAARQYPQHRFVVQHGDSRAPVAAEGHAFLAQDQIRQLLDGAVCVVCHGGPGTLMDARDLGHVPICVPRDPGLGEHVDGHQQRFARLMDHAGVVDLVETVEGFDHMVAQRLRPDAAVRSHGRPISDATASARELLAHELDLLFDSRVPRPRRAASLTRRGRVSQP